jgi:hypothetical protein
MKEQPRRFLRRDDERARELRKAWLEIARLRHRVRELEHAARKAGGALRPYVGGADTVTQDDDEPRSMPCPYCGRAEGAAKGCRQDLAGAVFCPARGNGQGNGLTGEPIYADD